MQLGKILAMMSVVREKRQMGRNIWAATGVQASQRPHGTTIGNYQLLEQKLAHAFDRDVVFSAFPKKKLTLHTTS